jgi:transposase
MKRWPMYTELQSLKNLGFSKRQVAEKLQVDFRTVSKYWDMDPDSFEKTIMNRRRQRDLSLYEGVILDWLLQYPGMTASQVLDWLKEHYSVAVSERTTRRFVEQLRKQHDLPKNTAKVRHYLAMEDPPMGRQMQVDLGVVHVKDARTISYRKLYCVACVLSHSRYKWGEWFTGPLTSAQLVAALEECFEYLGGMPAELVFDQDRLIAVDENYGDIIYTKEFEQFRQRMNFSIYLCRAADPPSKGRVEAVVKYFKNHYARHRKFMELDLWNDDFLAWLDRTGNARVHGTTKKIPAEVFLQEKLFLKPVPCTRKMLTPIVTRQIHKDNTVFYKGCRYTLPLGTFKPGRQVQLVEENGILKIFDAIDPVLLAEHPVSLERGRLVRNNNHARDYSDTLDVIQKRLLEHMQDLEGAELFLQHIRQLKGRYVRDQFKLIERLLKESTISALQKALSYCITNSLFSATELADACRFFEGVRQREIQELEQNPKVTLLPSVKTQKRPLSEYAELAKGGETP